MSYSNKSRNWRATILGLTIYLLRVIGTRAEGTADLEFFEKRVRPILVDRCYRCHSSQAEKLKGGLALDQRTALLKGGDSGPVLVPGQPDRSRLIEAIRYTNPDLQMPPKGRLSDEQIADLEKWVTLGAPWPEQKDAAPTLTQPAPFDLEARRQKHWAWKPIRSPALPKVADSHWGTHPVDRFIGAGLEARGLKHAPPAEPTTLRRRLSFDILGLPPLPNNAMEWKGPVTDESYSHVVEQLLASPQFGERWARHWLDLVRYSETLGHEFDYNNPNAWRYRDYVIRALNADVPYDLFVREHVAGDLLNPPRRNPETGSNESIIGPAFYWLGQREHSPVDVRQHQAELIDNQIDVLSKAFLGLTVACARCHDHKFDAIPTQDYYSFYSILSSSRYTQAAVTPQAEHSRTIPELQSLHAQLRRRLADVWKSQASQTAAYLMAVETLYRTASPDRALDSLPDLAETLNLDEAKLRQWLTATQDAQFENRETPLAAWSQRLRRRSGDGLAENHRRTDTRQSVGAAPASTNAFLFADFTRDTPLDRAWMREGEAFPSQPTAPGALVVSEAGREPLRLQSIPSLHSGSISRRLQGYLRSPTFSIAHRYVHILAAGRDARINIPVDNFTMIRDPIYGGLKRVVHSDHFQWVTIDLEMWMGHKAYLEFSDVPVPDPADDQRRNGFGTSGYLAVQQVVFSDQAVAPRRESICLADIGGLENATSTLELADCYQRAVLDAVRHWSEAIPGRLSCVEASLLDWLTQHHLLDLEDDAVVSQLLADYRQLERSLIDPIRVPSMADGTGLDEPVFVRGNHRLAGPVAPRRFLQALAGSSQAPIAQGSGRLELAQRMLDPENPFVARVIVNRVWLHLFGRGLVPTPDDFGELGQPPTHPELLDWLAQWFRTEGGWSIKRLIQLLVSSNTYRMSSHPSDLAAEQLDPENLLWHRMPLRRLEGEAIRDAMLAVAGDLSLESFGPPVPIHLTEFMDGRGRPGASGPLDGSGRRSIYIEVRRNFISPMMRAFDMPVPFTCIGRRTVSNVPAQSLILMNDPFVIREAKQWAKRLLAHAQLSDVERVQSLYKTAFARAASEPEIISALSFIKEQKAAYEMAGRTETSGELAVWADLCHVLFNVKEFVFLN